IRVRVGSGSPRCSAATRRCPGPRSGKPGGHAGRIRGALAQAVASGVAPLRTPALAGKDLIHMGSASEPALALLLRAAEFAAVRHRDQRRKGSEVTPYIRQSLVSFLLQ